MLGQDRLGHHFSLNYKGVDTHQTRLGAVLSIGIKILVLIILGVNTIDLIWMTDPDSSVNMRAIFKEEVEEAGQINFGKHKMHIGFAVQSRTFYDASIGEYGATVELPKDPLTDEEVAFSGVRKYDKVDEE